MFEAYRCRPWPRLPRAIAGAITLVEPLVDTVAHYFFDQWWGHPRAVAAWQGARIKLRPPFA
jgi:hypothetical protein